MPDIKIDQFMTEEQYLAAEINSETKHEYVNGQIVAMAGGSKNHDRISGNVLSELHQHLKGSPCETFGTDVKVKTSANNFRYTDGMVVCTDSGSDFFTQTPVIIVEVLSRSTRHIDKGAKLLEYINMPSMQEYVIIEQDIASVDVFRRSDGWVLKNYVLGENIYFESIDLTLSVEDIYYRIENEDMSDFLALKK
ncbi:Uma2 family endonuclease [Psychromonas hadalis]|uniref:Uma2 family endonuclease n=1 Tax=Psychromonas hadalis TaxID=211669 RepID=UPI0003B72D0D|nr:Uma2 family endonuclease [Psychromonas hadalis]